MSEGRLLERFFSKHPAHQIPDLEGAVVTGRTLRSYEVMLGIGSEVLEGATVLNFGSGGSHLGKDLKKRGINCNVVDLDLKSDPHKEILDDPLKLMLYLPVHLSYLVSRYLDSNSSIQGQLFKLERRILNTDGRNFIRGDGRALPFPDQSFNHVLALWSTYQIPPEAKEVVYRELMRVGNILHIGPIFGRDYDMLEKLTSESGYEAITCQPWDAASSKIVSLPFKFSSSGDYNKYIKENDQSTRILRPEADDCTVTKMWGLPRASGRGGNTIVLRRK